MLGLFVLVFKVEYASTILWKLGQGLHSPRVSGVLVPYGTTESAGKGFLHSRLCKMA